MTHCNTILSQVLTVIPKYEFEALTKKYRSNKWTQKFTNWNQFVYLLYGQLKQKDSLRDVCL